MLAGGEPGDTRAAVPIGIGVWLAPRALLTVRGVAQRQRRRALDWSGVSIVSPYRPRPVEVTNGLIGRLQRCKWLFTDPATWRDLLWVFAGAPAGPLLAAPAAGIGFGVVDLLAFHWVTSPHPFPMLLLLLAIIAIGVFGGPWFLNAHAWFSAQFLAPTKKTVESQLNRVTESRSDVVDASAAELRRIERDLHDGAQARLVALGKSIGMAEQVVRENPDLAIELLAEARASSGQALSELRSLARGIHPPVLAERGLAGAVQALALTIPIHVDLHTMLARRLPAPVESAAYFAVAEALTNVVKHSGAERAWVMLEHDAGKLVAVVGDNGSGGARVGADGGLRGIERRLVAFDGVLAVTSPAGGRATTTAGCSPCLPTSTPIATPAVEHHVGARRQIGANPVHIGGQVRWLMLGSVSTARPAGGRSTRMGRGRRCLYRVMTGMAPILPSRN
jgi:Putative sensor/Histidine kinase